MERQQQVKNRAELTWKHFKTKAAGHNSTKLRNEVSIAYQGLVRKVAHSYTSQCPLPYEDLYQIGMLGLLKAADKFRPTAGVAFSSFAMPWISGEILHHLRDHGSTVKVPRRLREAHSKLKSIENKRELAKLPALSESELAAELGVSLDRLQLIRSAIAHQSAMPLNDEICEIPQPETYSVAAEQSSELEQVWSQVRKNLENLHSTERELVELAFCQRFNQKKLGQHFEMSPIATKQKLDRVLLRIAQ